MAVEMRLLWQSWPAQPKNIKLRHSAVREVSVEPGSISRRNESRAAIDSTRCRVRFGLLLVHVYTT